MFHLFSSFILYMLSALPYLGETLSLIVAASWTASALFSEVATRRLTVPVVNVLRMLLSMGMIVLLLWGVTGHPLPQYATTEVWLWLLASGVAGYVFGDFCLFNAYALIGSRFAQLFMTFAPATAALSGWLLMGERLSLLALLGMAITMAGIGMSVLGRSESEGRRKVQLNLPLAGVLYAIGAAVGQGVGLVLSAKGLKIYAATIEAQHLALEVEQGISMTLPFASTLMRAVAGLVGFVVLLLMSKHRGRFLPALSDGRGMWIMVCAVFFGPFFGVSLSLLATQFTATGIAMTLMSLSPIMILWPAYVLFGQRVTWREVFGALVSVVGVSLFFV